MGGFLLSRKRHQEFKMKIFILVSCFFILAFGDDPGSIRKAPLSVQTRAPSGQVNCDCQCESPAYQWTAKNGIVAGDCKAIDKTGARFCYISRSAECACNDVKISSHRTDSSGRRKRYSYLACTTPYRGSSNCVYGCTNNNGGGNYGNNGGSGCRGKYCNTNGNNGGSYGGGGSRGRRCSISNGGGGNYGNNGGSFGSNGGSWGSSGGNYGSGSNSGNFGTYRPRGGNKNKNPSLDDILSGVRVGTKNTPKKSDSAIVFDA